MPEVASDRVRHRRRAKHVDSLVVHDQEATLFWYMISQAESKLLSIVALGRGA